MIAGWNEPGPTAVLEHGANPGLISHFTKQALLDIAEHALADKKFSRRRGGEDRASCPSARSSTTWPINSASRSFIAANATRRSPISRSRCDEFVNTWSVEGFREEGTTTAEMGWGTHEKELPAFAFEHPDGPKSQICLARMGINTWVGKLGAAGPPHRRHGRAPRRGVHALRRSSRSGKDGKAVYRPTVHYAYCPCDSAIASLHELRGRDYDLQPRIRIMTTTRSPAGRTSSARCVMGHPYQSWWCGTDLSIEESRRLVPHQNATTMQVAISVVAACLWMIENPRAGVCVPDDLPHDFVLEISKPYLGQVHLGAFGLDAAEALHQRLSRLSIGRNSTSTDPWQFKNFLITEGD